jgi:hypothetical protein
MPRRAAPTSRTFTIAPPAGAVVLEDGSADVAFVITSTADHAVVGTLALHATSPAPSEWLSLEGEATHWWAAGAIEDAVVKVRTPTGATPGVYAFRLDAKNEANPEEDYTEGPTVAFEVYGPAREPPWWRRSWWAIVAAVALLVAAGVGVIRTGLSTPPGKVRLVILVSGQGVATANGRDCGRGCEFREGDSVLLEAHARQIVFHPVWSGVLCFETCRFTIKADTTLTVTFEHLIS